MLCFQYFLLAPTFLLLLLSSVVGVYTDLLQNIYYVYEHIDKCEKKMVFFRWFIFHDNEFSMCFELVLETQVKSLYELCSTSWLSIYTISHTREQNSS